MNKITRLTPEQEQELVAWRQKWFEIGSCCEPANRPLVESAIAKAYAEISRERPVVIWCDSPLSSNLLINLLTIKGDSLGASLRASLGTSLRDSLWTSLWDSLGASLWDSLGTSLRASLWDSQITTRSTWFWGQMDTYWIAFYLFCEHIGCVYKQDAIRKLGIVKDLTQGGWLWPYENICIVSERPSVANWNQAEHPVLHCDGGPAVQFRDGWKIWALNGVRVSQEIAETPADEIDPQLIVTEQNAEIRREILRKIGVERALSALDAQTIDRATIMTLDGRFHDYELLLLPLDNKGRYPYLRMNNPSLAGVEHIEGVHESCKTVKDALAWRVGDLEFKTPSWIN